MSEKHSSTLSMCVCTHCGAKMFVPRSAGRERGRHHIKDIYCWRCKTVQKFVEYQEFYKNGNGEVVG